ncbi:ubiquitin domain-containing protein DSK2a isoform X2 [Prunus yedoensis var. nudiflora]|uniref:Ubiquitin domain-containing protein DSK2a isoform X2 n=1 Tax=Prunus yedoensis var. nudiflora TaxID=2094558 RepID=A0A314YH61_PRUYE|nr:ubiquitin domain-containing protein DSK2a isoform X2 [Prunus yedoensis var. nudiflora]
MGGGGEGSVDDGTYSDDGDGVKVNVNVRCSNGSKFTVQISLESTVGSFKEVLSPKCDIPAEQQRLIYKGRILKDDQTVQSYGLEADHTVHLVRGFARLRQPTLLVQPMLELQIPPKQGVLDPMMVEHWEGLVLEPHHSQDSDLMVWVALVVCLELGFLTLNKCSNN